ncbi:uncharacterized protein LOC143752279 [Siphateles boraxobius]|uniref:uncharacterized protein LOC143752279 n=1 Tax=Siphateles boraxobius TaxID=180520 RepID=UPI0040635123
MAKPDKSLQRTPVAASKVLECSPHGAPMPETIADRRKLKIPEPLRQELLQQKPQAFMQGTCMSDKISQRHNLNISELLRREQLQPKPLAPSLKIAPVCSAQGAPSINKISDWRNLKNPELLRKELLRQHLQNAPVIVPLASLRIPRQQREKWEQQQKILKGVSVPANTPQRTLVSPCSPQQAPGSPQGAPMPSRSKSVCPWSIEASENLGLCQSPPQKLCVEIDNKVKKNLKLRRYNRQAHQMTTSQLDQRTQRSLQPKSQLTRKRVLDNAGVDQSPPQKKQRMSIKVKDQQPDPGSLEQIDNLCNIFNRFCVISNI